MALVEKRCLAVFIVNCTFGLAVALLPITPA